MTPKFKFEGIDDFNNFRNYAQSVDLLPKIKESVSTELININKMEDFDESKPIIVITSPTISYGSVLQFENYKDMVEKTGDAFKRYNITKVVIQEDKYLIYVSYLNFDGDVITIIKG